MKAAITYCRVSTLDQAREGVSMPAQLARAEAWAAQNGYEIVASFDDPGLSGKRADNRPGLQAAIAAACEASSGSKDKSARSALVVYSLARLARSVPDAFAITNRLHKAGVDFVSLTEKIDTTSASGRLIFTVFAAVAAFEREITAERVADTIAHKRSEWTKYGEIKYGYTIVADPRCQKHSANGDADNACSCRLVEDPDEQSTLTLVREWRLEGSSWEDVAVDLNDMGTRTKKGKLWSAQNIRKIAISEKLVPIAAKE